MKQSSTDSHKKKLVQARLPFQILSPGLKNPESTPELRKRKASEDATICEVTEVKENQVAPVEKKPKIANSNLDAAEGKTNQKSKQFENEEEKMEVDDHKEKPEECKSLASHTPVSKGKCKPNMSKKSNKKNRKSNHNGKASSKSSTKKEIVDKSRSSESAVTDVVDLCSSPCKTEESPSDLEDTTKLNIESTCESKKEKEGKLNLEAGEESNKKTEDDENNTQESEFSKEDEINGKPICSNVATKQTDATTEKCESTSEESIDKLSNQSKCDIEKPDMNKTSPKTTVTNDCPEKTKTSPDLTIECDANISNKNVKDSSSLEPETPPRKSQSSLDGLVSGTPTLNESSTSFDVSLSSDCSTPTANSDTKKLTKKHNTPRRLTPNQLLKMKERENKLKEKERLKQEKEKKKAEEREEKQKLKQEKEEEKLKQKQEKEEEKRKEKEEKERKKQAEIAQKNEEKRLKEEEKRLKEEEKRTKDEEKKKKEEEEKKKKEEKRLKEEQKQAEKRKSAQAFASFFLKSENKQSNGDEDNESPQESSKFQPFEVKNDMKLAPLLRSQLTQDRRQILDTVIDGSLSKSAQTLYLKEIHQSSYVKGVAGKTWPAPDETDDDIMIIESEKTNGEEEINSRESEKKSEKRRHRAKLLQFHENRRPPYWGTWRKKSKYVRPRAPLSEDKTMFEYDIDSDDEWEEPEDGESLRGSENEESQDEQYEEDNDMFVPHGYLSDEEGQDDLDDKSPEAMKLKLKFLQQEFEAERNEKQEKLKPRLIGCVWFCNSETEPSSVGSHIVELFLARRAVWDGSDLPLKMTPPAPPTPPTPSETGENEESRGAKKKLVPESMIPSIIQAIHGSRKKLTRLLAELLDNLESDQRPSKRCFVDKVREIASWTHCAEIGHNCWFVKEEVRKAYNLIDLNISSVPSRVPATPNANITKFTKVLTSDERLRLLSSPKESPKFSTPSIKQSASSVKDVSPKVTTLTKANPGVKKRIALTTVGPVRSANSIKQFVSVKNDGNSKTVNNQSEKSEDKVKKRITPITLTSSITKPPPPPPSEDDCVVLSD